MTCCSAPNARNNRELVDLWVIPYTSDSVSREA